MKQDIHQQITNRIIAELEQGTKPWECPWVRSHRGSAMPINFRTGQRYRGINVVLLWMTAQEQGYSSNAWLTYKQAQALGGNVRKGERSTTGMFYKHVEKESDTKEGRETYFLATSFNVFNLCGSDSPPLGAYIIPKGRLDTPLLAAGSSFILDQIDGIEQEQEAVERYDEFPPNERAEQLITASGATVVIGGERAFYKSSDDTVHMPDRTRFETADNFFTVCCHELGHWTKSPDRLDRDFRKTYKAGESAYAFEELVAELTSAFLSATLGLTGNLENHASYIDSWLCVLKSDTRAVSRAASHAEKAYRYLMAFIEEDTTRAEALVA